MDARHAINHQLAVYDRLKAEKQSKAQHWQDILDYTIPHKAAVTGPLQMSSSPYRQKYDATGMIAATRFAGNMYTHLSPPNRRWYLLTASAGSALAEDREYGAYLGDRTEKMHLAMQGTNFHTEAESYYQDLGTVGTSCMAIAKSPTAPFICSTRPIGEYAFLENAHGKIDTVFCERAWTAYEAAKEFGLDKLSEAAALSLREFHDDAYSQTRQYLSISRPNEDWDPASLKAEDAEVSNLWVDMENKHVLRKTGSKRLRYVVSRFWRPTGMRWGMGPGEMAYSFIRCLDKISEISLKGAAKAIDPPLIVPDDGAFYPLDTTPGGVMFGRSGAMDAGRPSYLEAKGQHQLTQFHYEYYGRMIFQAFMNDLFQALGDDKQRTAREVMAMLRTNLDMLLPNFGRIKNEFFEPALRVMLELLTEFELGTFGWRYGGQRLPELDYELELISPLGLAIKFAELQKMQDLAYMLGAFSEIDPNVWDHYSLDDISRGIGENMAIPSKWKRSITEVRALREARAEHEAQQRALVEAEQLAGLTQKFSKAAEPNSPTAQFLEQVA